MGISKQRFLRIFGVTPVTPILGKLRQEDRELEASLGGIVRPCLN
jgi:hypothetical protein